MIFYRNMSCLLQNQFSNLFDGMDGALVRELVESWNQKKRRYVLKQIPIDCLSSMNWAAVRLVVADL